MIELSYEANLEQSNENIELGERKKEREKEDKNMTRLYAARPSARSRD
jgi:hypothetical protein